MTNRPEIASSLGKQAVKFAILEALTPVVVGSSDAMPLSARFLTYPVALVLAGFAA